MRMCKLLLLLIFVSFVGAKDFFAMSAQEIIQASMDAWRGTNSSYSKVEFIVTRPTRRDDMIMESWTKGDDKSLVKFIAPNRIRGQGLLTDGDSIWTYSPRSGRVIKIANSSTSKSWMGSDLSYDDISKSTKIINQYKHTIVKKYTQNGHRIVVIESVPKPNSAIVWGKEIFYIDDRYIPMTHDYYDQGGTKLRTFVVKEVQVMGGKPYPSHIEILNLEKEGYKTEFITKELELNQPISNSKFTMVNLKSR